MVMGNSYLSEPGFYVWAGLLVIVCLQLVATLAVRPARRRLLALSSAILAKEDANDADRAWLSVELDQATRRSFMWFVALAAPLLAIVGIAFAWTDACSNDDRSLDASADRHEVEAHRIQSQIVSIATGKSIDNAKYWATNERIEIQRASSLIEYWKNPFPALWIGFWLLAATPFVIAAYLVLGSVRNLRSQLSGMSHIMVERLRIAISL